MNSKLIFILTMVIFGTIGLVRRYIPLPSSIIALCRAGIGTIVLFITILLKKERIHFDDIYKNIYYLIPSGILLGFNWILLFEAYQYTSIAVGTLCYYMAPIFVIIISSLFLKDKINRKQICCILIALSGMILVSDLINSHFTLQEMKGIYFGLASALFYCMIMIFNSRINAISAYDKTIVQLGISTLVLIPYVLISENIGAIIINPTIVFYLLIAGIIHTGLAYVMYFGSMSNIPLQSIAILSYIDPVVAIIISILLHEPITLLQIIGAILVLGASLINEINSGT